MRLIVLLTSAIIASPAAAQPLETNPSQPGQPEIGAVTAGTYTVDPAHTQVMWEVNHMGFSMLVGMFGASEGSLTHDPENLEATQLDVTIPIEHLAVSFGPFAKHLHSPDFFDLEKHPSAQFVSTSVEMVDETKAVLSGDLTIKGVTHPIAIDASFIGAGINPMDDLPNVGFAGSALIKRSDFDLGAYAPGVSDEVAITINAAFVLQQ